MILKSLTIQCPTPKMRFFKLFIENKNLIKQGLYLLEICQNAAGSTDLATDRRGHDGLSWTPSSHTCAISSSAPFITLDDKYYGSSNIGQSIEGLRSKILKLLEYGYWDYFSELHDELVGRTVTVTTDRRGLRNPTLS